jgi:hypothetical protein
MYAAAPGAVVRDAERQFFMTELLKEIRGPGKIEEAFNRTLIGVSRAIPGRAGPVVFLVTGRGFLLRAGGTHVAVTDAIRRA